jgi:Protein of unknown function (DUF3106)
MRLGLQFGAGLCGLGLSAVLLAPCVLAQDRPSNERPPARQQQPQPREASRPPRNDRPAGSYHPQGPSRGENRDDRRRANDWRPAQAPPPNVQERLRNMSPQDRQRLAQNEQRLRSLSPAQQQELRDRARVWQRMTPEQREHIRNDVLPKWRQLPPQRQKAIQQRLGVLQNMPESARNRHLSDPNFTRGMNEEDKQLLRDLSHQHVGGMQEQAQEQ